VGSAGAARFALRRRGVSLPGKALRCCGSESEALRLSERQFDEFAILVNGNRYHLQSIHRIDQQLKPMTDLTRPSTLSLRRSAAALASRPKSLSTASADAKPAVKHANGSSETSARMVGSDALLQGHSHVSIVHNGETYQLRATRLGKLILTK
jgi:hemin uptake protein HemP